MLPTRKKHSLHTALYAVNLAMYRNANYTFFSTVVLVWAVAGSEQATMWCSAVGWCETMAAVPFNSFALSVILPWILPIGLGKKKMLLKFLSYKTVVNGISTAVNICYTMRPHAQKHYCFVFQGR